jgi:hypothetical protein
MGSGLSPAPLQKNLVQLKITEHPTLHEVFKLTCRMSLIDRNDWIRGSSATNNGPRTPAFNSDFSQRMEKKMANPILVTGAAGRVGGIGRSIAELLLKQGEAVRAMVRNEDRRSQSLRDTGAEIVTGDLLDLVTRAELHRAGRYDRLPEDMLTLTGQAPLSVREFVRKNAAAFIPSAKDAFVSAT